MDNQCKLIQAGGICNICSDCDKLEADTVTMHMIRGKYATIYGLHLKPDQLKCLPRVYSKCCYWCSEPNAMYIIRTAENCSYLSQPVRFLLVCDRNCMIKKLQWNIGLATGHLGTG